VITLSKLFHLPDRPRQVRARLVEAIQRRDLVVVRARQRILGLNHFDVVRHSRLETVPRLIHFLFRKLHAQVGHLHFISRRLEIQQRGLHIQRELVAQVVFLLLQFLISRSARTTSACIRPPVNSGMFTLA